MNPTTPSTLPEPSATSSSSKDEIFVLRTPEKKPLDKKSITLVTVLTILGVLVLLGVLVAALIGSASSLAGDYRRLALIQIKKIDSSLDDISPSTVLDKRSLDKTLQITRLSEQSQPSLENVLFIGSWSREYVRTEKLQVEVHDYYKNINQYEADITSLILFDDHVQALFVEEAALGPAINPSDSLTIRSVSGSYDDFVGRLQEEKVPSQLRTLRSELVKLYQDKAGIYLNWAKAVEAGDTSGAGKAQQELSLVSAKVGALVADEKYSSLFNPAYQKLLKDHESLKKSLAS